MKRRMDRDSVAWQCVVTATSPITRLWGMLVLSSLGFGASVAPLTAQVSGSPPQATAPASIAPPCAASEFRQFDFWVGRWEVRDANDRVLGTNTIDLVNRGCGLREQWSGASGFVGTSVNTYDAGRRQWHQTWIDSGGMLLILTGHFRDGVMSMSGETVAPDGKRTMNRIQWRTAPERGSIRQTWEQSDDGGRTWKTAFDGWYFKR
ncbi:MAG TPA: hypothetical protein VFZ21_18650 [Gemmatimonadaceae bacterium]|nr:hypothetical protein [Gemmatimonadaceae bacterium]